MADNKYVLTNLTARYQETDMMGIIHHSVYPIWFEAARTDLIKEAGFSYSTLEKMGLLLPLISLEVQYLKPAVYEDNIVVKSSIALLSRTRLNVSYEVYRENDMDTILSVGKTFHVFTDKELKPVNVQKIYPEVYRALVDANK